MTEFGALYELHGDAVFRSAAFVSDTLSAESVTIQVFVQMWRDEGVLDHTDGGWRSRLVASSVALAPSYRTGWPEDDDTIAALGVLGFVRFGECDYRRAAVALRMSEDNVLRCLRVALDRARTSRIQNSE